MNSVLDPSNRRINLSNEGHALDSKVLDALRKALLKNEFYVRLSLTGNRLDDDCVAMVCAILKDSNYIQVMDLNNCAIKDRDLQYYIIPAILARNRLRVLNLCKNTNITDTSASAIGTLIREGSLTSLHLGGTGLTKKSGDIILKDLERNSCLEVLELPYSIGFTVLDKVKNYLEKSKLKKKMLVDARTGTPPSSDLNSPVGTSTPLRGTPSTTGGLSPANPLNTSDNEGNAAVIAEPATAASTIPRNTEHAHAMSACGSGGQYRGVGSGPFAAKESPLTTNSGADSLRMAGSAPACEWLDPAINRTLASLRYMEQGDAYRRTTQNTRVPK